jgi:hypothetical protein
MTHILFSYSANDIGNHYLYFTNLDKTSQEVFFDL